MKVVTLGVILVLVVGELLLGAINRQGSARLPARTARVAAVEFPDAGLVPILPVLTVFLPVPANVMIVFIKFVVVVSPPSILLLQLFLLGLLQLQRLRRQLFLR